MRSGNFYVLGLAGESHIPIHVLRMLNRQTLNDRSWPYLDLCVAKSNISNVFTKQPFSPAKEVRLRPSTLEKPGRLSCLLAGDLRA